MPTPQLSPQTKARLKTVLIVSIIGIILGPIYAYILKGDFHLFRVFKGAMMGLLITSTSSTLELFVFPRILPRLPFSTLLVARSIFYILLVSFSIIIVSTTYESIHQSIPWLTYLGGEEFSQFLRHDFISIAIFATLMSFAINFIWQVNRLLGQGVLLAYITGRYFHATEEEKIFMFLDMNSSTTIAERLGHKRFSELLNDFFFDMTGAILESRGEIYQYVGDEVVISWEIERGLKDNNSIRCFFRIQKALHDLNDKYIGKYGLVPGFKGAIHAGRVVVSEIGDIKREIVFHGDTMNTTARILSECKPLGAELLVSGDLVRRLPFIEGMSVERIGEIRLRGKESDVTLYRLSQGLGLGGEFTTKDTKGTKAHKG
jgi:adenylate cyclase